MPEMMSGSMNGILRLGAAIDEAAARLDDTAAVSREGGDDLLAAARLRSPAETGRLRGAHRVRSGQHGAVVTASTPYAARQHFRQQQGRPGYLWLHQTLDRELAALERAHGEHARHAIRDIGGQY